MSNEVKVTYETGKASMTADVFAPDGTDRETGISLTENGSGGLYLGDCATIQQGDIIVAYDNGVYIGSAVYSLTEQVLTRKAVQNKSTGAIQYYDHDDSTVILTQTPSETDSEITREPS